MSEAEQNYDDKRAREEDDRNLRIAGYQLTNECHTRALANGWWTDHDRGGHLERNIPEMLMLIVSEVAEAMEGVRNGLNDDKLPDRSMLEVELADALIRIYDMAGGLDLDVSGALVEKLNYNDHRADHQIENRRKEGGKKF